jgi:hypothetical protein
MSITDVCVCGAPLDAHRRENGSRRTCEEARRHSGYAPVNVGTLLRLALDKHTRAKKAAVDSIRLVPRGWSVRLGGRYKGFTVQAKTISEIHDLIDFYFSEKWKQRRLRPRVSA